MELFTFSNILIFFFASMLLLTAIRLNTVKKEVVTARGEVQEIIKTLRESEDLSIKAVAKLNKLSTAWADFERAQLAFDGEPRLKKLKLDHPDRVEAQDRINTARNALAVAQTDALRFLDGQTT